MSFLFINKNDIVLTYCSNYLYFYKLLHEELEILLEQQCCIHGSVVRQGLNDPTINVTYKFVVYFNCSKRTNLWSAGVERLAVSSS